MSNSDYTGKVIRLDTFSSAISIPKVKVFSIEWTNMNEVGDECRISMSSNDPNMIEWTAPMPFFQFIKYFDAQVMDIYIAAGGVGSGIVIIYVR